PLGSGLTTRSFPLFASQREMADERFNSAPETRSADSSKSPAARRKLKSYNQLKSNNLHRAGSERSCPSRAGTHRAHSGSAFRIQGELCPATPRAIGRTSSSCCSQLAHSFFSCRGHLRRRRLRPKFRTSHQSLRNQSWTT